MCVGRFGSTLFLQNVLERLSIRYQICRQFELRFPPYQRVRRYISYLNSLIGISSWTSVRGHRLNCQHDQLPSEVWSDVLMFLLDDAEDLKESFLVADLRCGFLLPRFSFSLDDSLLLSMIPLIEGHFQVDIWTYYRLRLLENWREYPVEAKQMSSLRNEEDCGPKLKRAKFSCESAWFFLSICTFPLSSKPWMSSNAIFSLSISWQFDGLKAK